MAHLVRIEKAGTPHERVSVDTGGAIVTFWAAREPWTYHWSVVASTPFTSEMLNRAINGYQQYTIDHGRAPTPGTPLPF